MNLLPPGQIETGRFPIVGERHPSSDLSADPERWHLDVTGLVERVGSFDLFDLRRVGTDDVTFDIHCVTSWTRYESNFTGIRLADLLVPLGISGKAKFVSFEAYSERNHHTSLPLDVALEKTWVVHSFDNRPLSLEHGGPVRTVTPDRYFYKSIKWLKAIRVLDADRLGWWEANSAYHNNADPRTGTERFTTGSLRPAQVSRFLSADSYDKYRGRVILGLDLRSWKPKNLNLTRLYLKNCDLRGVDLGGTDLRNVNLSMSDLRGTDLSGSDLSGADLEGVNFIGADLSGANLSGSALSATRFADDNEAAKVEGLSIDGAWGLVESQEEFLQSRGVAPYRATS